MWLWWASAVLFTVITIIVPQWTWLLSAWQFRSPEAMEPSPRRWRVVRASSAVILVGLLALLVGSLWPGDIVQQANAGVLSILIGDVVVVAVLIAIRMSGRYAERRARDDDEAPPNELSELGYGVLYIAVGATAAIIFVIALIVLGTAHDRADRIAENSPEAQQQEADEAASRFNELHPQYDVVDAVPPGGGYVEPIEYAAVDSENRKPRVVWDLATVVGSLENDAVLDGADLVVGSIGFSCSPTAIVVVETETTVNVAIAVSEKPAADAPDEPLPCVPVVNDFVTRWFPIDLAAPLGDRDVRNLDGGRIQRYMQQ